MFGNFNQLPVFARCIKSIDLTRTELGMAAIAILLFNAGCAVHKTMHAVGGSRSDGIVKMSYSYQALEQPIVNEKSSRATAAQRCRAWGYADAQPFGGGMKNCIRNYGFGCEEYQVTIEYQCTGGQAGSYSQTAPSAPNIQNSVQSGGQPVQQQIIINVPAPQAQSTPSTGR